MRDLVRAVFNRRMFIIFLTGFSSGLPLLLTLSTLQAWMKDEKVDLATIGLFSLSGLPYTLKFLWSPLMDRYIPLSLGRRRSWMLLTQIALILAIVVLGFTHPAAAPGVVAMAAVLVSFFSASQDIVIDAYRRELLSDNELGLGSSLYINGYRLAMLVAGAGALFLADRMPWQNVYLVMALLMGVGVVTTLLAPEAEEQDFAPPKSLKQAVVEPFVEYFRRDKAWTILLFILLYKIGDTMATAMTTPFILDLGFTKTQFAAIGKSVGLFSMLMGGFVGGIFLFRLGISRALWVFGFVQGISIASFSILASMGNSLTALAAVVAFENFASGMGTSAYAAYMASITNKQFTATQYALLTSLMGIPRVLAAAPSGWLAKSMGWHSYFIFCTLLAVPGLLLLFKIAPWPRSESGVLASES